MHPILFDFGTHEFPLFGTVHLFLPTYGALFALGALLAWAWFVKRARSIGLPQEPVFNLAFYTLLAGLLGAKLALVLVDLPEYIAHPADLLGTIRSAGVLMGGIVAGAAVFVVYASRQKLPVRTLCDAIAAPLVVAQGIGRLGCFAAGCCYGVPSGGWCAVTFTSEVARAQTGVPLGVGLVPVQLIEAAFDAGLALVLTALWRRRVKPPGTTFWIYLMAYGAARGILEFLRGDTVRGLWLGGAVSTSQLLSLASIAAGAALLIADRRRTARDAS